jgi:hypothetical protein
MNIKQSSVIVISFFAPVLIFGLSPILKGSAAPLKIAQSAEVKGSTVKCNDPKVSVAVPSVKVSAPNPSRLVPNVGRILREGTGLPVPDSEAPNVEASAQASVPATSCASNTTNVDIKNQSHPTIIAPRLEIAINR